MKIKFFNLFNYIVSRFSFLRELIEIQKELIKIMRNISQSQNQIELKLSYLLGEKHNSRTFEEITNRILRENLKKKFNLNIRNFISKSGIFESHSSSFDLILECLDDDEKSIIVLVAIYSTLTYQDVIRNIENLDYISKLNPGQLKLVFLVSSANDNAIKISEDHGIAILFSDSYFPKKPGSN